MNMAHGELMLGAYLLYTSASLFVGHPFGAIAVGCQPDGRRAGLRRSHAQDDGEMVLAAILTTIAIGILLRGLIVLIWSAAQQHPRQALGFSNPSIELIGGARISSCAALIVIMTVVVYGGLFLFLRFGRWGVRMRGRAERAAGGAARRHLNAVYALAWGLSTLTGSIAGMLIALDSGLDQTMVVIGSRPSRRRWSAGSTASWAPDRRAHRGRRRGARHPLRRSAPVRRGAVPGAHCRADRAPWGLFGTRRSSTVSRQPSASGYFRTRYEQDLTLSPPGSSASLPCSCSRCSRSRSSPPPSSSISPARSPPSARLAMLLTGYAGQISLGHAGHAAGAFTVGILFRETNARSGSRCPPPPGRRSARIIFGLPSLRLRGLYLAVSTLAAFRRDLSRRRVRIAPRLLHRHPHRPAQRCRRFDQRWPRLVLHPAGGGGGDVAAVPQSDARAHRPGLARSRARDRRRARHRHRRLQGPRLRHQLGDHRGRRRAVRLLPRLRLGRGVLAVPHHPVPGDGDHRRHGIAARGTARRRLRHPLSLRHRGRPARASRRATLCRPPVRGELRRLRPGDDPVPDLRAARPGRHLASHPELFRCGRSSTAPVGARR